MIDPARTFSSVYASEANGDALQIIERAARGSRSANPIVIRGPVGTGKTQLLHATANAMLPTAARPVRLLTAAGFRDDYIHAIRSGPLAPFRKQLAASDGLLVDGRGSRPPKAQAPGSSRRMSLVRSCRVRSP